MRTRRWAVGISLATIAVGAAGYTSIPAAGAVGFSALRLSSNYSNDLVALSFSPIVGEQLWAGNGGAIYRSDDGGIRWRTITPPNLVGDDAAVRVTGFTSYGGSQLWFSATEAGNVTRHLRAFAIDHSADGADAHGPGRECQRARAAPCPSPLGAALMAGHSVATLDASASDGGNGHRHFRRD
jgi:hypothetical protein